MVKLLTTFMLITVSFGSYAQINTTIISKKSNETVLKHDSVSSKLDSLASRKPNSATAIVRICAPSRSGIISKPPLFVIKYGKKEYRNNKDSHISNLIPPKDIAAINVLKDSISTAKYGEDGQNGIIIITLKDDKVADFKQKLKLYKKQL